MIMEKEKKQKPERTWTEIASEAKTLSNDLAKSIGRDATIVKKIDDKLNLITQLTGDPCLSGLVRFRPMNLLVTTTRKSFLTCNIVRSKEYTLDKELTDWLLVGLFEGLKADIREARWIFNRLTTTTEDPAILK